MNIKKKSKKKKKKRKAETDSQTQRMNQWLPVERGKGGGARQMEGTKIQTIMHKINKQKGIQHDFLMESIKL